ncbi:DnaJ-domain-containing protein [Massarina eburnea CBS 473.64]|uniref:DnaJ-domain-containing protein n=1 Tax=Massarina eburnea CBS 473.64 TaxID=1395130 RepID=A0A6A6S3A8_9PLEO|nr:DnaJ-domain-containing protein [Massarina eburnea CBS 473.64]
MGAQQSTADAGAGAAAVDVKTSYYELLGVERTATDDEIKKAYRRKALELHPDRNYGDTDRTTALFADVQSAYEVLSDPQERSWYDAHEGDILRGASGGTDSHEHYEYNMRVTTTDDISRMMGRFRTNIDFSDSPNGFYGFVRETFEQLASEEAHAADYEGMRIPDYPSFGHKADSHEDVVRDFYAVWNEFATCKTFAWMDAYRTSDATDRRMRRLMEKENRKFRDEGIRAFNEAVRTLVAFVRKRDPRYTPDTRSADDAAKAQREANKARAAKLRAEQTRKMMEEEAVPDWAKARDPEELVEESEEEVEEDIFECVACHKTFKSERQYDAHEKSKKHQKAVYALKKKMQKDNAHLNLDDEEVGSETMTPMSDDGGIEDTEVIDDPVEEVTKEVNDVKLDNNESTHSIDASDEDDDDDYASRSDIQARLADYRKPGDAPDIHNSSPPSPTNTSSPPSTLAPDAPDDVPPPDKKVGAAAKKRAKRAAKQESEDAEELKNKCAGCQASFPSKTQLFQHIKNNPRHVALKTVPGGGGAAGGKKKGKRR